MAKSPPAKYVQARFQQSLFEQHRRVADIGNGGKPSGSGGEKAQSGEPREKSQAYGKPGGDKAARPRVTGQPREIGPKGNTADTSGMEQALGAHADKMHPVKR